MHSTATFITLHKWLADTKIYFTEVHNAFTFQIFLTCRSYLSADQIQQD